MAWLVYEDVTEYDDITGVWRCDRRWWHHWFMKMWQKMTTSLVYEDVTEDDDITDHEDVTEYDDVIVLWRCDRRCDRIWWRHCFMKMWQKMVTSVMVKMRQMMEIFKTFHSYFLELPVLPTMNQPQPNLPKSISFFRWSRRPRIRSCRSEELQPESRAWHTRKPERKLN